MASNSKAVPCCILAQIDAITRVLSRSFHMQPLYTETGCGLGGSFSEMMMGSLVHVLYNFLFLHLFLASNFCLVTILFSLYIH